MQVSLKHSNSFIYFSLEVTNSMIFYVRINLRTIIITVKIIQEHINNELIVCRKFEYWYSLIYLKSVSGF